MESNINGMIENAEQKIESSPSNEAPDPPQSESLNASETGPGISDDELQALIDDRETSITVVGCGGGGCNTINRMEQEGIHGADLIAMNTDVQHLTQINADTKYLLGQQQTGGKGTGSLPQIGEQAAIGDESYIKNAVTGSDMVFVTAGLGGGTGTGVAPVVARNAKQAGALTIAVVTMPFMAEGDVRRQNAEAGLERLSDIADTVIVIPNDRLLDTAGSLPIQQAFKVADETLMRAVKGITELITQSRMVNLDFSDIETVMQSGGLAMIGFGDSDSKSKARDAVQSAIRSPLLDVDISGANAALVNVTGGPEMAIEEAEGVVEEIYDRVDPNARIIWGTGVDESLGSTIRTMIVVTGISSPQIYGDAEVPDEVDDQPDHDIDYVR